MKLSEETYTPYRLVFETALKAPYPQIFIHNPQFLQFSRSITGALFQLLWVIAPVGQYLTTGQGWFCGHLSFSTIILCILFKWF